MQYGTPYFDDDDDHHQRKAKYSFGAAEVMLKMSTTGILQKTEKKTEEQDKPAKSADGGAKHDDKHEPATSDVSHHSRPMSDQPFYSERFERSIHDGQGGRVLLSGHDAYARTGEVGRVSNTFQHPDQRDYEGMGITEDYEYDNYDNYDCTDEHDDDRASDHDEADSNAGDY